VQKEVVEEGLEGKKHLVVARRDLDYLNLDYLDYPFGQVV